MACEDCKWVVLKINGTVCSHENNKGRLCLKECDDYIFKAREVKRTDCKWLLPHNKCNHEIYRGISATGYDCTRPYCLQYVSSGVGKESSGDTGKNDGGSADYYKLPNNATDLQDLIEHKAMNFSVGNILKSAYRLNDNTHSDYKRDLKKIIWFANRELEALDESEPTTDVDIKYPFKFNPAAFAGFTYKC